MKRKPKKLFRSKVSGLLYENKKSAGSCEPVNPVTKKLKKLRGFAAMKDKKRQREIARMGGKAVSKNRRHMADIGRIGGEHNNSHRRPRKKAA